MKAVLERARGATLERSRWWSEWERGSRASQVLCVTSNKGGVGKTTIANNLAVYFRAMHEDLPVLVIGLDDQPTPDQMFALDAREHSDNITTALRKGNLDSAIQLGQYGVHYVPSSPDVYELKAEIREPFRLQSILHRTDWRGIVIVDTKSDLEILTRNAIAASDLALVIVKDHASVLEADKVFALLESWKRPRDRARVLLSMIDLRIKYQDGDVDDVLSLILSEIRKRDFPLLETFVSASPKVESLGTNPTRRALPVLHGAEGSLVHEQMRKLAEEAFGILGHEAGGPAAGGRDVLSVVQRLRARARETARIEALERA